MVGPMCSPMAQQASLRGTEPAGSKSPVGAGGQGLSLESSMTTLG